MVMIAPVGEAAAGERSTNMGRSSRGKFTSRILEGLAG